MKVAFTFLFILFGFAASAQDSPTSTVSQTITITLHKVAVVEKAKDDRATAAASGETYNVTAFDAWLKKAEKPEAGNSYIKDPQSEISDTNATLASASTVITLSPL